MSKHPEPRPRDDTDAVRDIARDLAEVADTGLLVAPEKSGIPEPRITGFTSHLRTLERRLSRCAYPPTRTPSVPPATLPE